MKVYIENKSCDLHIRVHFEAEKSFPVAHVENLFVFTGYVDVLHNERDLPFSPDGNSYLLPPLCKELELTVEGKELYLSNDEVGLKQLSIMGYAMRLGVVVEILRHKNADFKIEHREVPKAKKALQSAALHLEIAKQATGVYHLIISYTNHSDYLSSNTMDPELPRSRRDYIKLLGREMKIDEQSGALLKKMRGGGEKVVVNSPAMYEKVVTASLNNGGPLCSRGINVRTRLTDNYQLPHRKRRAWFPPTSIHPV